MVEQTVHGIVRDNVLRGAVFGSRREQAVVGIGHVSDGVVSIAYDAVTSGAIVEQDRIHLAGEHGWRIAAALHRTLTALTIGLSGPTRKRLAIERQ